MRCRFGNYIGKYESEWRSYLFFCSFSFKNLGMPRRSKRIRTGFVSERWVLFAVPSIVVHKGSRSHSRPDSPTVVVRGGMPTLPSSRQGFVASGSNASYQNSTEPDMLDGNANPNVGSSPASNSHHRGGTPSCPPDNKSDTENKNFRNRVRVVCECA